MADAADNVVENTQRSACASLQECAGDDQLQVGVGCSARKPAGDTTTDIRKRPNATLPTKQEPAEKRPRGEVFHAHESGLGAGAEIDPHLSQGPPPRPQWPSSRQMAYRESIQDATIRDPTYANIGDRAYIPNAHQQARGQLYPRSQPRARWSQEESQDYDENGYIIGARSQNWQERAWNTTHWDDSVGYPTHRGGGWRGGQSSARIPTGGYPAHPTRPPSGRPGPPRRWHPMDFDNMREPVYMDRNGFQVQSLQRRDFYDEGDQCGYNGPNVGYNNFQTIGGGVIAPLQVVVPKLVGSYPMAAPRQTLVAAAGGEAPNPFPAPSPHPVPSSEASNPEMARMPDSAHPEDSTHTPEAAKSSSSGKKQRRHAQHVYEAEELDRKARGLKPHVIECNSLGEPDESGKHGSRFLEVLRALCTIFLDVSIIKVMAQDPIDYASLREEVDSEFEFTGHPISDYGFKKAVSKCMKAERSRLHKLFITKPDRECPTREEPCVWERLKAYWQSAEFEKVPKRKNLTRDPTLAEIGTHNVVEDKSNLFASLATRLEALENNKLERDSLGVGFAAILAEISVLNSNVKLLTGVVISTLKQIQDVTQHQSKQDEEKTLASSTPGGKTVKEFPAASLSPCTKKHGSQKGNGSCETGPQVSERTRLNTKPQSRTLEERRHGSTSPGSDGIFAPARLKVKATQRPRRKTTSNAQGKALAKENALSAENEAGREVATGKTIPPSKKNITGGRGRGVIRSSGRACKPTTKGTWMKGELVDMYHPDDPDSKVAECCTVSGYPGEPFHGLNIAEGMFKVNVGRVFDETCPLFVTVEEDMPPKLTLLNVKRGVTLWPGYYLREYEKSSK